MIQSLSKEKIQEFQKIIREFYKKNARVLPWRKTINPYHILVSELMLQQTQVERVIPKYTAFLKKFPTLQKLSNAPLSEVLILWQGLGYNRRAKYLHLASQYFVREYKGRMPKTVEELQRAPGIGAYTAGAIMAFAYDVPVVMIETNIRTVVIYHFGKRRESMKNSDIMTCVEKTLPKKHIREWYSALMDYGTYLKKKGIKTNARVKGYKKQSPLKGSRREIRGAVLTMVTSKKQHIKNIIARFPERKEEVLSVMNDLVREGFVSKKGEYYSIVS